jgi:hypothetical protein
LLSLDGSQTLQTFDDSTAEVRIRQKLYSHFFCKCALRRASSSF